MKHAGISAVTPLWP